MKRRQVIHSGILGLLTPLAIQGSKRLFTGTTLSGFCSSGCPMATIDRDKRNYDWIFLYWMPYDNDLSFFGPRILEMLTQGLQTDKVLVVVQADFLGAKQLLRITIASGRREVQKLSTANSASEAVFAEYLDWAHSNFSAKKWAIVFLGHGGRLTEISPDEHPQLGQSGIQWMNIQTISEVIQQFNQQIKSQVELFFFQNCNKGTIEAHYTLRKVAKYTLSSQKLLGAPNYYYENLLRFLGQNPNIHGGQLAVKIMEFERSDMYNSYTVTENRYFDDLPEQLNPPIEQIIAKQAKVKNILDLKPYRYQGEAYVDLVFFLNYLVTASQSDRDSYDRFIDFFKHSLIYKFHQNPQKFNPNLSGLGLFLPENRSHLESYRNLSVFSALKLPELFETILFET